jgi:hypothetical protein
MMKWKVCGRKRSRPNFEVQSLHSPGDTEENHENLRIAGLQNTKQEC